MLAAAKINLTLHVTGQRADGYHLLDSLVVFAEYGDRLSVIPKGFDVSGPFAAALADTKREDNLVWRAAQAFSAANGTPAAAIGFHLEKNLPVASGIGGGSADCAAALALMNGWFSKPLDAAKLMAVGLPLGADVPVCLAGRPARMQSIGDDLSALPPLPDMAAILVNPGVAVSTPAVFKALPRKDNLPMAVPMRWDSYQDFIRWLAAQRNDLQAPAIAAAPIIEQALKALDGADIARMSGSGATVFGLCASLPRAEVLAAAIAKTHPDWWVQAAPIRR